MHSEELSLKEALTQKLPQMIQDEKARDQIIEILQEYLSSGSFDQDELVVESLTGKGDYGEFSIDICGFHGIYWVTAPDFEDMGYFLELDEAIENAKSNYDSFITAYLEGDEDDEANDDN